MFVSGAAFSVYKTIPAIPSAVVFYPYCRRFGFDWILLNLTELPHAVQPATALKLPQILSLIHPPSSSELQLPLKCRARIFFPFFLSVGICFFTGVLHLFFFWLKRHFLTCNKSASHVEVLALPVGNSVIRGVGSHFSGTPPPQREWRVGSMLVLYKGSYPPARLPQPPNTLPDFDEQSNIKWQALFPGWLSKNDIN